MPQSRVDVVVSLIRPVGPVPVVDWDTMEPLHQRDFGQLTVEFCLAGFEQIRRNLSYLTEEY